MGVDQERHFGVELTKRGVGRKRHLHEVADAAHVHEHLIRSFFGEASAKLANHRTPVLPLSLRPSTHNEASAAVFANQFGLREDVALHGALDIGFGGSGFQIEFRIEGVEFEEIAMWLAGRWAWTAVSDFAEIVAALAGAVRKLILLRDSLGKFLRVRREVKQNPVHPGAYRRVGIVHDECEALRLCRWFIPSELRRDVRAVACKPLWDRFPGRKSRARYLQRHGPPFL